MSAVIEAVNLVKEFPSYKSPPGFKEWLVSLPRSGSWKKKHTFTAVNGVNFRVEKGECLGVIGKNGAGKSTLLSLLLGTSYPTSGEVTVCGKRTPLLELGAGFHPDLTGRENVFLNAVLLGLTRAEAGALFDEIVRFSEIESFIDNPVRTYSSGMYVRLAFSVAIHTHPEVLLIDEILAVGDESFQKKSENALVGLIKSGVTTVFVSHNLEEVKKICSRVLWLHEGAIREQGAPDSVIPKYLASARPGAG